MKRSIAAFGAAIVGLSGAVVAATPAQAATTPDCATSSDHKLKADPAKGDFYFDCVPQYGVGKSDLTLTADETQGAFPEDFDFTDPDYVEASSSVDSVEASAYLHRNVVGGLGNYFTFNSSTSLRNYSTQVAAPIVSARKIASKYLPATCKAGRTAYDAAYKISFAPVSITLQTTELSGLTAGDAPGKFFVTATPSPLYLGLNFAGGDFDQAGAQCSVSGVTKYFAANSGTDEQHNYTWNDATSRATTLESDVGLGTSALYPVGAAASLKVSSKIGYGTPSLSVRAGGASTVGTVQATVDGKASPVAAVANAGKATVAVSPTLKVGTHEISVSYSGDSTHAAGEKSTTFVVTKATTVTGVKLSKRSAKVKSTRLTASTTVKVPGTSVTASGKVAFSVNGKVVKTVTLKNGKATGTLPVFTKTGTAKVVATYLGSSKLAKDSAPSVKVAVK